jgi:chromosome segregation ATPase
MNAPELLFWAAAETAKKPEGMTFERWLTFAGFLLSATLGLITLLKFLKERKEAKSLQNSAVLKAPAEKDVIIVTGAQSAVLMMEQAAKAAREEADRYKADLDRSRLENEALKEKLRSKDEKIDELQEKVRDIALQLKQVTKQLTDLREQRDPI